MGTENRELGTENWELDDSVRGLMADPRWGALEELVNGHREELILYLSDPRNAGDYGRMAHAAGSVDALGQLMSTFRGIKNSPKED